MAVPKPTAMVLLLLVLAVLSHSALSVNPAFGTAAAGGAVQAGAGSGWLGGRTAASFSAHLCSTARAAAAAVAALLRLPGGAPANDCSFTSCGGYITCSATCKALTKTGVIGSGQSCATYYPTLGCFGSYFPTSQDLFWRINPTLAPPNNANCSVVGTAICHL